MGGGFKRFTDIHAWQAALAYKRAVYRVCAVGRLSADRDLRDDLQRSVKGPPSHIAEGFGRFNPPDFARFVVVALKEATGLIKYLQSPEALRNAGRPRDRGIRSWLERRNYQAAAEPKTGTCPGAPKQDPNMNTNLEAGTRKSELACRMLS